MVLQDYLVYRAMGGIYVQIAATPSYTFSGEEKWVGQLNNGNWVQVVPPSPAKATPLTGNPGLGWVSWTDYATPKYTKWNPPLN